jgi:hypothetical protein
MGGRAGGGASGGMGSKSREGAFDKALEQYVSGEGMWINQYLRGNGDFGELTPDEKKYLADLDKATSGQLGKDYDLYRAADAKAVFGNISDQEYNALVSTHVYGAKDKYYQKYVDSAMQKTGGVKTEKGFMSTTTSQSVAEDWGGFTGASHPIVMKFKAPRTTKGKNLSKFDVKGDEQHEVLLGKGQKFKVGKVYGKNGKLYVDVTLT